MKSNDVREFAQNIEELCRTDAAYIGMISAILRDACPTVYEAMLHREDERRVATVSEFPARDTITAAQVTIYDNWNDGQKPSRKRGDPNARKVRYKAVLDFWCGAERITTANIAYHIQINLMTQAERLKAIERYRDPKKSKSGFVVDPKRPRSPEWQQFDDTICAVPAHLLSGPAQVSTNGAGTGFGLNIIGACDHASLNDRSDDFELVLYANGESYHFRNFVSKYAGAGDTKHLAGNAILTCRLANATDHVAWRTGLLSCPVSSPDDIEESDVPF